jgi:deoxycytidine triphosphate deaminase
MQVDLDQFRAQMEARLRSELPPCTERYEAFQTIDPFPDIPRALLHSGHLASYAIATGMIDPFEPSNLVKPATYAVPLMGPCRYLDEHGKRHAFYLSNDPTARDREFEVRDKLDVKPNSICYITLKPYFRLPIYIAGRFNLVIREVYRGLLVGTGPLVDPGFDGHISIPIHNFTNRIYVFSADENFVYFEFTKLSWSNPPSLPPRPSWCPQVIEDQPPFPANKRKRRTIDDYIVEATSGLPAQSAIGEEIRNITQTSEATKARLNIFTAAGAVGVGALIITALTLAFASYDMLSSANRSIGDLRHHNGDVEGRIDDAMSRIRELSQGGAEINRHMDESRSELGEQGPADEAISAEISKLRSDITERKIDLERVILSVRGGKSKPAGGD